MAQTNEAENPIKSSLESKKKLFIFDDLNAIMLQI